MEDLAPVLVCGLLMMVPIVKILVNHQQKMTELLHRTNQQPDRPEIAQIQSDVQELKALVHQQAIAIDNLTSKLDGARLEERLAGKAS